VERKEITRELKNLKKEGKGRKIVKNQVGVRRADWRETIRVQGAEGWPGWEGFSRERKGKVTGGTGPQLY